LEAIRVDGPPRAVARQNRKQDRGNYQPRLNDFVKLHNEAPSKGKPPGDFAEREDGKPCKKEALREG
jgi:hypothetical protein